MSKRPRVSLSSIVAETARLAGESSTKPSEMESVTVLDEGAPTVEALPRLVAPAAEPEPSVTTAAQPVALAASSSLEEAVAVPASVPVPPPAPAPAMAPPASTEASSGAAIVGLPAILDLKAAAKLRDEFCAAKGGPLDVDASKVQRLGGLCLQVLLSAQRTWAVDGKPFRVVDPSPDFLEGVKAFGAATLAEASPQAI
jgi:chemotaxis protein CheX